MENFKAWLKQYLPAPLLRFVNLPRSIYVYQRSQYVFCRERNIIYVVLNKNACTSIRATMSEDPADRSNTVRKDLKTLPDNGNYFKFTFVRNPFSRLYSCYKDRVVNHPSYYDYYLGGYLCDTRSFAVFVRKINNIPVFLADEHFTVQYHRLYKQHGVALDFIGKYENLHKEFEPIRKKYRLNALPHLHKSHAHPVDWRDHYTRATAAMVYRKYKQDFDTWYPHAYDELIAYLDAKRDPGDERADVLK